MEHGIKRLSDFEPLSHEQKIALIPFNDIDDRIKPLIKRLNDLQLYTDNCCQGANCKTITAFMDYVQEHPNEIAYYPNGEEADWVEWPNGQHHSQYAYINFEEDLPIKLLDKIAVESDKLRLGNWGSRVESSKMKYNSEFHIEFDRILNVWENQNS